MTKIISSPHHSDEIVLDAAILQQSQLKSGDEVHVEIHPDGAITITPFGESEIASAEAAAMARHLISKNDELFRRLSK